MSCHPSIGETDEQNVKTQSHTFRDTKVRSAAYRDASHRRRCGSFTSCFGRESISLQGNHLSCDLLLKPHDQTYAADKGNSSVTILYHRWRHCALQCRLEYKVVLKTGVHKSSNHETVASPNLRIMKSLSASLAVKLSRIARNRQDH